MARQPTVNFTKGITMDPKHLLERRNKLAAEMASIAALTEPSTEQESRFDSIEAEIRRIDRTLDTVSEQRSVPQTPAEPVVAAATTEQRSATPAAPRVEVNEPDMYGKYGQRSWFCDLFASQKFGDRDAEMRLRQHAQIEAERREKRSANAWRGQPKGMETRSGGPAGTIQTPESRGLMSSSDAAGGYLVPPADLNELFVDDLKNEAVAASMVTNLPLPEGVQLIRLPKIGTAASAAIHTQGNTISKTDATFGQVTANVYRLAGGQNIANFLLERGTPATDLLIMQDLSGEVSELLSTLVLHGTNSSQPKGITKHAELESNTVTYDAVTATYAGLHPKYVKAIGSVAENRKRYPTGALMAPRRVAWLQGQVDADGRPFLGAFAPMNAIGSTPTPAAAGLRSNIGGVDVYSDGNMRVNRGTGTDEDDIIVGVFADALLWQSPIMFGTSREERFSYDETVVKVALDMAFMPDRRADSFWVVQGTGLNDVL